MLYQARLNSEPTTAPAASQVAKMSHQVAFGNALDKASTTPSSGDHPRGKHNGTAATSSADLAKSKPAVVASTDSGPKKVSTPRPKSANLSDSLHPDNGSDINKDEDLARNPKGEGFRSSIKPSDSDRETEVQSAARIMTLWSQHKQQSATAKLSRNELKQLRDALSTELHAYKTRLVGTGRDGRWAEFLREREIPLATADRYVKRREDALARAQGKVLTEELPPTAAEVTQKVQKLAPGLIRFLGSLERSAQFVRELETAFQTSFSTR